MKAIKFVILVAGVIGLVAFFLPYFNLKLDESTIHPTGLEVMTGLEIAKKGAEEIQKNVDDKAENSENAKKTLGSVQDAIDIIKAIIVVMFAPALLLAAIGGVGAGRGRLGRLGGAGAMVVSLIGLGTNGIAMMLLSDSKVQSNGMSPGIALYLMVFISSIGFICGLLTVIKPDEGGRFG
jgi:hypothetical protein